MNFAIAIVTLFIGAALQARLPAIPALGVHLEFLPALVAYGALTFGRAGMLTLALAAGFTQDALSAGPFGVTAIIYTAIALFVHGYREVFDRELAPLQIGAGVLITVASSIAACSYAGFHVSAILKIALLALLAALLTPILFFVLDFVRFQVRSR
jgi:rod shape-determining protein MreD